MTKRTAMAMSHDCRNHWTASLNRRQSHRLDRPLPVHQGRTSCDRHSPEDMCIGSPYDDPEALALHRVLRRDGTRRESIVVVLIVSESSQSCLSLCRLVAHYLWP